MSQCKTCDEPLVLAVTDDDDNQVTVPDDLQLGCGCRYHWECLMENASAMALSLKCPSCDVFLPVNQAGPSSTNTFLHSTRATPILARYSNEGGVQEKLDILPSITEEAYVQTNPETRPARAFHVMCSEGDVDGIVELVQDRISEGDAASVLRYQDPLAEMKSGLHIAVEKQQEEVLWLLLWLASAMPTLSFPAPALDAAKSMGLERLDVGSGVDIRSLQDSQGRTAEDMAKEKSDRWVTIVQAGVLKV